MVKIVLVILYKKLDCYENVSRFLSLMSQGYKRFSSIFLGFTDLIC